MDLRLKYPPEPEYAKRLAATCVDAAERISGLTLNYSVESLLLVEKQLDAFANQGMRAEQIASTLFCFGCYVGELMLQRLGGRWVRADKSKLADLTQWPMVIEMRNGDCWNPIGKVFKRFDEGQGEDLTYFFSMAASSMQKSGQSQDTRDSENS
jgi:hypothetical protein